MRAGRRQVVGLLLAALTLGACGCHNGFKTPKWMSFDNKEPSSDLRVEQRVGGQATDLAAVEVIRIMRRIGLADDQIRSLGPALRDAMRAHGAAAMMRGEEPQVVLVVNDEHLFVQSRSQGSFIYDIKEKRFIAVPPMPAEGQ